MNFITIVMAGIYFVWLLDHYATNNSVRNTNRYVRVPLVKFGIRRRN